MKQAENKSEKMKYRLAEAMKICMKKKNCFFVQHLKQMNRIVCRQHDFKLILEFYTRQIEFRTGQKFNEKLKFLLEMYCQAAGYMTTQWVLGYRKSTPEKMHAVRVTRKIQM